MPIFTVSYEHPDVEGWRTHLAPHVAWLRDRLADGSLLASGPVIGDGVKSAVLIIDAPHLEALHDLIAGDPFAVEGLIVDMQIQEWDPIFGAFSDRSSMPGFAPVPTPFE